MKDITKYNAIWIFGLVFILVLISSFILSPEFTLTALEFALPILVLALILVGVIAFIMWFFERKYFKY